MSERATIGPSDVIRGEVESDHAEGGQASSNRVALALLEGGERLLSRFRDLECGLGLILGLTASPWTRPTMVGKPSRRVYNP